MAGQRLHLLLVFATIVRRGSLTAAAAELGVSKSVVSANLRALEAQLGVRLLERTTRRMALTQVGEEVFSGAEQMLAAADDVQAAAEAQNEVPTGLLRVSSTLELGRVLVAPAVAGVLRQYPGVRSELVLDDRPVDLVGRRIDVAVRLGVPADTSFVSRKLAEDDEIIVAAPEVAAEWAGAADPGELESAPWLAHHVVHQSRQTFVRDGDERSVTVRAPRVSVGDLDTLRVLALQGAGLAVVPAHAVLEDLDAGRLVRLVDPWVRRRLTVYALLPSRRYPRRVQVFLEALEAQVRRWHALRPRSGAGRP